MCESVSPALTVTVSAFAVATVAAVKPTTVAADNKTLFKFIKYIHSCKILLFNMSLNSIIYFLITSKSSKLFSSLRANNE